MSVNLWGRIRSNVSQDPTAKRLTASKEAEVKSEFREVFKAQKSAVKKVESKDGDTLTISQNVTIAQKMNELREIHERTDYSGMTDVERYRLITDRYEEVFPCMGGKLETNYDKYKPVAEQIVKELDQAIPGYSYLSKYDGENYTEFLKTVRGYQGLSKEELIEKTNERYLKEGSLTEKAQIMRELWGLGVIDGETYGIFTASLGYLERQEYRKTFNVFNLDEQSDHYRNWIKNGGMENLKVDWEELKKNLFENIDVKKLYGEEKKEEFNNLFEILGGK